jgi:ComF family protein
MGTGAIVDRQGMISAAFWPQLTFIDAPHCATCGLPFSFETPESTLCASCLETPPEFDCGRAAVVYNAASRKLILGFKYGDRLHTVHTFTPWLARAGADLLLQSDLIVPVPLHARRLWQRRFNQSALLGAALARHCGKTCLPDALVRLRHTTPQKGLSRKHREENVKNAFGVNKKRDVTGKNILLIDDVFTSGATLNACARTLKKAGAHKVFALAIARVTREEI